MTVLEAIQKLLEEDPNLDIDAYGSAQAVIKLVATSALRSPSMGAGAEESAMNRVLDALRED